MNGLNAINKMIEDIKKMSRKSFIALYDSVETDDTSKKSIKTRNNKL
jgi:hypothetical protein